LLSEQQASVPGKQFSPRTIGGRSSIGAAITSTLLIVVFGFSSLAGLFGAVCAWFADFSDPEETEIEETED